MAGPPRRSRQGVLPAAVVGALSVLLAGVPGVGAGSCPPQALKPLIWQLTKGDITAFVLGIYPIGSNFMPEMTSIMQEIMSCADVAYFQLPCSLSEGGGHGYFMNHCMLYPVSDPYDSVSKRLSLTDIQGIRTAVQNLVLQIPKTCPDAKAYIEKTVDKLTNETYRVPLKVLYADCLSAIDPFACHFVGRSAAGASLEDILRNTMSGKPIFGLEDISLECSDYTSNTVQQDQELGRRMIAEFSNGQWLKSVTTAQQRMQEIMMCGELEELQAMVTQPGLSSLPHFAPERIASRTKVYAEGISTLVSGKPQANMVFVLNVQHFLNVDSSGAKSAGIIELMEKAGFTATRVPDTQFTCSESHYRAPGAKELDQCVRPAFQHQPESCRNFRLKFESMTKDKGDRWYGAIRNDTDCQRCATNTEPCTCLMTWNNVTAFRDLCSSTEVNGVRGRVYLMDVNTNAGSHHHVHTLAPKLAESISVKCFATTCNMALAAEIHARHWYQNNPALAAATVNFRPWGTPRVVEKEVTGVPNPFGGRWEWWMWAVALLVVFCLIGLLILCFRITPRRKTQQKFAPAKSASTFAPVESRASRYSDEESSQYEELKPLANQQMPQMHYSRPQDAWQYQQQQQQYQEAQLRADTDRQREAELWHQQQQEQMMQQQQQWQQMQQMEQQQQMQQMQQQRQHMDRMEHQQHQSLQSPTSPFRMHDGALLQQAMQAQRALGDAGAQAVQQMQMNSMNAQQYLGSGMTAALSGTPFPQPGAQQAGSPFATYAAPTGVTGSGALAGQPGGLYDANDIPAMTREELAAYAAGAGSTLPSASSMVATTGMRVPPYAPMGSQTAPPGSAYYLPQQYPGQAPGSPSRYQQSAAFQRSGLH